MIRYQELIATAIRISWRHKFLWAIAFFAALAGNGGEYELLFSGSDSVSGQSYLIAFLRAIYVDGSLHQLIVNVGDFFGTYPLPSIFLTLLGIVLFVLVVWLIMIAQAGLIWAISKILAKSPVGFHDAFSIGAKFFSPIFLINALSKIIIYGIILLIALPVGIQYIKSGLPAFNTAYILITYIALIPVAILLSFIVKYASAYIVLQNQPWKTALKNGWLLFTRNWLVSLEVAFLLFVINLVSSLAFVFLLALLGLASNPASLIIFYVLLTLFGVFVATFQYAAWVQVFLQLDAGKVESKIQIWSNQLFQRKAILPPQNPKT